ncbi:hypothetical protein BS78_01G081400 [Paspalum vaginatum]|nr:hypothetical protein BS78_01G081400 [Paspalum vaginatum]
MYVSTSPLHILNHLSQYRSHHPPPRGPRPRRPRPRHPCRDTAVAYRRRIAGVEVEPRRPDDALPLDERHRGLHLLHLVWGRVASLRVRGLSLAGGLDALDPAAFPSLTSLILNDNNLVGAIPPSLSWLRALATLDLGSNRLDGTIPPQPGDLSGLVDLRFYNYNNNLAGNIPKQLRKLPKMVHFDLGSNYLTSTVGLSPMPTAFLSLNSSFLEFVLQSANITYLNLSQNAFSGLIPDVQRAVAQPLS